MEVEWGRLISALHALFSVAFGRRLPVPTQSHSLTVTDGDGHSTRCHRPLPDAIHATMYFMLLHRSVNSR